MAAALDLAAAVFAIIGVADVAVRSGLQVSQFLRDIADAPSEVDRLCDSIRETIQLAGISKDCLKALYNQPTTSHGVAESLNTSLKGLNRELHSLSVLSSKFKETHVKWSRVRYVLDKRRIVKSLDNIERSKTLLTGTLVVVCRELSAIDHSHTAALVQNCSAQLGLKTDIMARKMSSTLQEYHQDAIRKHDDYQKVSAAVQATQAEVVARQAQIARTLEETQKKAAEEHKKTRKIICAKLGKPLYERRKKCLASERNISFFGERRDMIVAYLLLAKTQLEILTRQLLLCPGDRMSARHVGWLQSEIEHLVVSATHEASKHSEQTCKSLDRWCYSENTVNPSTAYENHTTEDLPSNTYGAEAETKVQVTRATHRRGRRDQKTLTHVTPFGHLRVYIPSHVAPSHDTPPSNEVGFTFTCGIGQSIHVIIGQFFRQPAYDASPPLCAQLNVFTLVESEEHYNQLFADGSIEEVDVALRQGVISPYHINREGRNMCLYFAAEYVRKDILGYFDGQGIGVSNLKHDFSLVAGFFRRAILNSDRPKLETSVDFVLERVYDSSFFLTEMTMGMLLWDYYKSRPRSLITKHLQRLQKEGLIEGLVPSSLITDTLPWDWDSVSSIIHPLATIGAYIHTTGSLGRNPIQRTFGVLVEENCKIPGNPQAVEEIVNLFIRAGVDIHHRDNGGLTPSMYARRHGHWHQWCRALERSDKCIETILLDEKTEWLVGENWREVWREKYSP
ncbi:hypothetical protein GQ44DRAFT_829784 [Phaeosphaeriaceae sp. PMI808]|nr:hypothetical protein GQ44DRAFT_829784 [Phaeosphaeriaceae sp. PMI808]